MKITQNQRRCVDNEIIFAHVVQVTCIICRKPGRLHGIVQERTTWMAAGERRLLTHRIHWPGDHTRGKLNSCSVSPYCRTAGWVFTSGVGVSVSGQQISVRICKMETIVVFDQFHNWCNPANRYISNRQQKRGVGMGNGQWEHGALRRLKCFEFIQE